MSGETEFTHCALLQKEKWKELLGHNEKIESNFGALQEEACVRGLSGNGEAAEIFERLASHSNFEGL